jgi:transposase
MGYNRVKFEKRGFDENEYKRHFHQNQAEYIRAKLRCVVSYHEGKEYAEISSLHKISEQTVRKYVNVYILGGFEELCKNTVRNQSSLISPVQGAMFKELLLNKRPSEVDLEGNIWTGELMRQYLKSTYDVDYRSGIYDLLERLNLTHQKAHLDYGNADPAEQRTAMNELKTVLLEANEKTAVFKFDEFSVCDRPTSYYGWAEKNTRPKVVTNEKKETEQTGC